jgi:hypothetical protein
MYPKEDEIKSFVAKNKSKIKCGDFNSFDDLGNIIDGFGEKLVIKKMDQSILIYSLNVWKSHKNNLLLAIRVKSGMIEVEFVSGGV